MGPFVHRARHFGRRRIFAAARPWADGAVIRIDGEVYQRIDLRAVTIPYDIEVQTDWGTNTVHVEPDGVSVTYADCPDHLCVQQGKITTSAIPIACVPHHLTVQIEGSP